MFKTLTALVVLTATLLGCVQKGKKKIKPPHQRTPETKPKNLILASLNTYSVPGMGWTKRSTCWVGLFICFIDKFCLWELLLLGWN